MDLTTDQHPQSERLHSLDLNIERANRWTRTPAAIDFADLSTESKTQQTNNQPVAPKLP